jgi:hypothetical protein
MGATVLLYILLIVGSWMVEGPLSGGFFTLIILVILLFWPEQLMRMARKIWIGVGVFGEPWLAHNLLSRQSLPMWLRISIAIPVLLAVLIILAGLTWAVALWQWQYAHAKWPDDVEARLKFYKSVPRIDLHD